MESMGAHEPSTLTDLPLELLLIISESLSPIDVACLSLSSRKLQVLFRENETELLKAQPGETWLPKAIPIHGGIWNDDRAAFLLRLSLDVPPYFFCYTCSHLHPWEMVGPRGPAFQPRNRLRCQGRGLTLMTLFDLCTYYNFDFFHVQLAMRGFFYGPRFGISTKSLSYTEVRLSPSQPVTTLLSVQAGICPDTPSLYMWIQHLISVTRSNAAELLLGTRDIMVCNHIIRDSSVWGGPDVADFVSHCLEAYRSGAMAAPELKRCRYCNIDFKFDIKEYGDDGLALVITRWVDLGSGITPDGTRWNCHLPLCYDKMLGAPDLLGDSRNVFENLPGESEEELLSRNISYLSSGKYKAVMGRFNKTTWFLQAESRVPRSLFSRSLAEGYRAILALSVSEETRP
ncbi:hypothetical protein PHISCL_02870 [Aspergillus sclerotialis]|uniref:F-box domain-containing protein n=1 Tax=Aspergillus sclerotialis TaxID=2070753 RepID=A0A3A2ZNH3_9EURO|nr:hypothetical protein PHISCL_02870 [Aspergillus sclerotialis]